MKNLDARGDPSGLLETADWLKKHLEENKT